MKKYTLGIIIYLTIGIIIWQMGYIQPPTIKEGLLTFLYVVLLWPIVIIMKMSS